VEHLATLLLTVALGVQLPLGALAYVDARRLGLRDPVVYALGVIVPAGGFFVVLYYASNRRSLPKAE